MLRVSGAPKNERASDGVNNSLSSNPFDNQCADFTANRMVQLIARELVLWYLAPENWMPEMAKFCDQDGRGEDGDIGNKIPCRL